MTLQSAGQITVVPSTNSCSCDGSAVFNNGNGAPLTYTLSDYTGAAIDAGSSANGIINMSNLCSIAFLIEITQGGVSSSYVFNVPTTLINPGDATTQDVCATATSEALPNGSPYNLPDAIPNLEPGGLWSTPINQLIAFPFSSNSYIDGWYSYAIPSGGCDIVTGVLVNAADAGVTTTYLICDNYEPFEMVNFLEGTPELNGYWLNEQFNPVSGTFNPATQDDSFYYYIVDDAPGCGQIVSVLTIDEILPANAGGDNSIEVCDIGLPFNMFQYLNGNPDPGGTWFDPLNNVVTPIFDPATNMPGTYRYRVSAAAPCPPQDNAFLTITFIDPNPAGEPAVIDVCASGSNVNMFQALNGSPVSGGYWTSPTGQNTNAVFDPQNEPPGNYLYNYPNVGCPQSAAVTIQLENDPNAGPDNSIGICENVASINLNGQLSAGTQLGGQWSDVSGNPISNIFPFQSGITNYTLVYHVEGNVCPDDESELSIQIENLPAQPADLDLSFCFQDPVVDLIDYYPTFPQMFFEFPNGNPHNGIYDPSTGIDATIQAIAPSGNSCPNAQAQVTIDLIMPLFENPITSVDLCNLSGTFDLSSLDPDANLNNGDWYDANGNLTASIVDITSGGNPSFQFIADNAGACGGSTFDVQLNIFDLVEAGENGAATFCSTDSPQNLSSLLPSSIGNSGSWSFAGQPFNSTQFNPSTDLSGIYTYTVPANGSCPPDQAILTINVQEPFLFDAGEDQDVCEGSVNFHLGGPSQPNTQYSWSPTQFLNSANSSQPVVQVPASINSDLTITYQVFADNGVCSASDEVSVSFHVNPSAEIGDIYEICLNDELSIAGSGIGEYTWQPQFLFSNPTAQEQHLILDQNQVISLLVTNEFGCVDSDTAEIIVHPYPVIVFTPNPIENCPPLLVEYSLDPSSQFISSFTWNISEVGNFTDDTLRTEIENSGLYTLTVTALSDFGCERTSSFPALIEVYPTPVADFSSDPAELTTIDPIAQFIDESFGADNYWWNFNGLGTSTSSSPIFEFPNAEPTNFNVCLHVTNNYGCADSTCRILHLDNNYIFFAPNAITPDDDGINDFFSPVMMGFEEDTYTLQIFNRWGDLIFSTNKYGEPWIANVDGGDYYVQEDVYIWQVQVKDKENAEYRVFKGTVTVIR